jgi:glucose-6-phosphate 1-dehydrogenase
LFGPLCERLGRHGLAGENARVVVEKPIGKNLESARLVNDAVGAVFPEDRVYRIDHYLGKEAVQNLMALRFANGLFEPLWNAAHIDHVQITVAESLGVGGGGGVLRYRGGAAGHGAEPYFAVAVPGGDGAAGAIGCGFGAR